MNIPNKTVVVVLEESGYALRRSTLTVTGVADGYTIEQIEAGLKSGELYPLELDIFNSDGHTVAECSETNIYWELVGGSSTEFEVEDTDTIKPPVNLFEEPKPPVNPFE